MGSNKEIEKLNWDSEFFGKSIWRINKSISSSEDLKNVTEEMINREVDLAYYSSPYSLEDLCNDEQVYDISLVDKKVTYSKEIDPKVASDSSIVIYQEKFPSNELIDLAIQSGIYSRFNIDTRIGWKKYQKLYTEWIINSVNKQLAKEVLVYCEGNLVRGFVTLNEKDLIADIGLIATNVDHRGKGIGKKLMRSAEYWFARHNYTRIQVVTQFDNLGACKLYESCGYKRITLEYFYHFWKK